MRASLACAAAFGIALASTAHARDSLGMFGAWGAFADKAGPRCYAIALAENVAGDGAAPAYASVGTWPRRAIRGQVYFRTSQPLRSGSAVTLSVGPTRFTLTASGQSAWARDARGDAAIVAAMRSSRMMRLSGNAASGKRFSDRYDLDGAVSALDAATVGCARSRP